MKLSEGDKVRIIPHVFWPDGGTGVVALPNAAVRSALADKADFDSTQRAVHGESVSATLVWVKFDQPIQDGEGDGPYPEGEVEIEYLEQIGQRD